MATGSKLDAVQIEDTSQKEHTVDESRLDRNIHLNDAIRAETDRDEKRVRKIIRRVDFRMVPILGLLYMWALIDRVNLPNIQIAGMGKELETTKGNRYTLVTMIFFVTYILFDYPSNIALRKLGAARWLGFIGTAWGCLTIAMGFVQSWKTLLVCRVIFGALEAGMAPGCIYLLGAWYTRYEVQKRFAAWACIGVFGSGISSALVYGITTIGRVGGLAAWRWIFIIEGIISAAIGILAGFILIDFPDRATRPGIFSKKGFLTPEEAAIVLARVERDRADAVPEPLNRRNVSRALQDWKMWQFPFLLFCNNLTVYSFSYFLPIILHDSMGYSTKMTYFLTIPPYVCAAIWMFAIGCLNDRLKVRGPTIIAQSLIITLGICIMAFASNAGARYFGVFLAVGGTNSNIPTIYGYQHNNLTGQTKRALATAMLLMGGGCGGIAASFAFQSKDAPDYIPGMITAITSQVVTVVLVSLNWLYFLHRNNKAEKGEVVLEQTPGFRYTY
ncbi:MFS general substrate transporter [Paraphaeosphaeria sporulosa]|uniref:MFS general substrate transporter n=1 Tax=Paraphaeosphaeria sporulosa TaxID=1460663 RepID=A0A177CB98_9PLEO|nr:MFS general substrate transporter [Paraphaeosphaeria sporulosa]OAG04596.1 MFS general substrate transporter [Paraphaeosphaeria sporulosa]